MNKLKITATVAVVLALGCSAMAATGVGGYRWGTWTRLDNLEGTDTNAGNVSIGVRNGKLGVAYIANKAGLSTGYAYCRYSEYAYVPGTDRVLTQTVTNEDIPASMGTYFTSMHGLQFDSAGTPLMAVVPYGATAPIKTRTGPGTYTVNNATNSGVSQELWGYSGASFVLDASDRPHYAWVSVLAGIGTQIHYGVKSGGVWSNMVLVADVAAAGMASCKPWMVLDSNDYPHVSYTGSNTYAFHVWQDADGTHQERLGRTDMGNPAPMTAIAMDTNGRPMVAHVENSPPAPATARIVVEMFNGATWTTNVVLSRASGAGADLMWYTGALDLKLDKNGTPSIVVAYQDYYGTHTVWIDFYTWNGSSWTGGNIGTFLMNANSQLSQVNLVFDNAGRPFVSAVMKTPGTANTGVYLLTTVPAKGSIAKVR